MFYGLDSDGIAEFCSSLETSSYTLILWNGTIYVSGSTSGAFYSFHGSSGFKSMSEYGAQDMFELKTDLVTQMQKKPAFEYALKRVFWMKDMEWQNVG